MNDIYSVRGRIFDIQKFSVHDGPGIRTIVFLKGCSLRCRWCCNPESQEFDIQEMKTGNISKTVGKDTTVGEIIEEVLKDRIYYRRSGGGLTLSGGECLLQADFSQALLAAAKENGINTAIETAGNVHFEDAEKVLPYLDNEALYKEACANAKSTDKLYEIIDKFLEESHKHMELIDTDAIAPYIDPESFYKYIAKRGYEFLGTTSSNVCYLNIIII